MPTNRSRRTARHRLALTGVVSALGLAILAPAAAQAAPSAAAPAAAAPAQGASDPQFYTKGTKVTVRNTGDKTMWVREFRNMRWYAPEAIEPGGSQWYSGITQGADDVELNVFFDKGQADRNVDGVNVDAENPAYSSPWMSVDWDSEYFSVGGTHTWVASDGSRFWGKRNSDSSNHKEFELHVTNR